MLTRERLFGLETTNNPETRVIAITNSNGEMKSSPAPPSELTDTDAYVSLSRGLQKT